MVGCELQPTDTTMLPTVPASVNVHFDQAHHNSESKSKKNKSGITGRVIGINFVKPLETEFFFKEKLYLLDPIRSPFRSELVHGVKNSIPHMQLLQHFGSPFVRMSIVAVWTNKATFLW